MSSKSSLSSTSFDDLVRSFEVKRERMFMGLNCFVVGLLRKMTHLAYLRADGRAGKHE